ncbi:hypothetical protein Hypma_006110 [Hypsizygus marmoreus]|uniref:Uncharacterized protein n=1 Tax=Hypsizygus marmoreus TaxID=39966 RepID=A0A369K2B3_HYPMA|nr:hypothetical protein Hypma_006110 [Hypsizygus marmoreus]
MLFQFGFCSPGYTHRVVVDNNTGSAGNRMSFHLGEKWKVNVDTTASQLRTIGTSKRGRIRRATGHGDVQRRTHHKAFQLAVLIRRSSVRGTRADGAGVSAIPRCLHRTTETCGGLASGPVFVNWTMPSSCHLRRWRLQDRPETTTFRIKPEYTNITTT